MNVRFGKCFWRLVTLFAMICMALPAQAEGKKDDKVAQVNGAAISRDAFDREVDAFTQRMAMQGQKPEGSQFEQIRKNVLENLINRELLWQESQKSGNKVEEAAVKQEFENWKKQFPDETALKDIMQKMNLSEEIITSQIRQQMVVRQFIDKKFAQITISEEDSKAYYDKHPDFFRQPEQVKASHILVKTDAKADPSKKAEARKKLEDIRDQLKKGEDFAALAKKFSDCPSSSKGGDLGYFGRGQMVKPFEDTAFALKSDEVSDIVETRFGFHLIKSVDKKAEMMTAYKEVKDKLGAYLKQEKKREKIASFSEALREKAKIERFLQ